MEGWLPALNRNILHWSLGGEQLSVAEVGTKYDSSHSNYSPSEIDAPTTTLPVPDVYMSLHRVLRYYLSLTG